MSPITSAVSSSFTLFVTDFNRRKYIITTTATAYYSNDRQGIAVYGLLAVLRLFRPYYITHLSKWRYEQWSSGQVTEILLNLVKRRVIGKTLGGKIRRWTYGIMQGLYMLTWVLRKWLNMDYVCDILELDLHFYLFFNPDVLKSWSKSMWCVYLDVTVWWAVTTYNISHQTYSHLPQDYAINVWGEKSITFVTNIY